MYVDNDASDPGEKNAVAENEAGIGTTKGPLTIVKAYSFRCWSFTRCSQPLVLAVAEDGSCAGNRECAIGREW